MDNLWWMIILLALVGFAGSWWLLCRVLSLMGWGRLAAHFASGDEPAPTARFHLGRSAVGRVSYKNVIVAEVSPRGLRLRIAPVFRPGHPPLLIPWAAIGSVGQGQRLWAKYYCVPIRFGVDTLDLRFTEDDFARALHV